MNYHRLALLWTGILLAVSLAAVCLVASPPAVARAPRTAVLTVCPAGPPDCGYDSIQAAVNAAAGGDVIKVATGVYTGVRSVPAPAGYVYPPSDGTLEQVAYVAKTLTLRGGYAAPGFADPPDPVANPTTIDAAGAGRGLVVWGPISATIEGLRLMDGAADGLGGHSWEGFRMDVGGCLYSSGANVVLGNNHISGCVAMSGGGVYIGGAGPALLTGNTFSGNTGHYYGGGQGGGAFIFQSTATLADNHMTGNYAGSGGGLYLREGTSLLHGNLIDGNNADYDGGGLGTFFGRVTLDRNEFVSNTIIISAGNGGAIRCYNTPLTLTHNLLAGNVATWAGGALRMEGESVVLDGNRILGNMAHTGGAVYLYSVRSSFSNDLIAGNRIESVGSGLVLDGGSAYLRHATIARNTGGDGVGVEEYPVQPATIVMTNTIIAGQAVGVSVSYGSARMENTLWGAGEWANGADWAGTGTFLTGTVNLWADPRFVAPAAGDYHIDPRSAAVDAGIDAGVLDDVDGEPRPRGCRPDIGADEYPGLPPVDDLHLTGVLTGSGWITATLAWSPPDEAVTYTLCTSASLITDQNWVAAALLTDSLPGSTGRYTAAVSYEGGTAYFALKWAGCGDSSAVSNNAFWPRWAAYLPLALRRANLGR